MSSKIERALVVARSISKKYPKLAAKWQSSIHQFQQETGLTATDVLAQDAAYVEDRDGLLAAVAQHGSPALDRLLEKERGKAGKARK